MEPENLIKVKKKEVLAMLKNRENDPQTPKFKEAEEQNKEQLMFHPQVAPKPFLDPAKQQRLKKIISDISNNKCYPIVYNRSEWFRSGANLFFNQNDVPSKYDGDEIINNSNGVVISNMDLGLEGEFEADMIKNLCLCLESNTSIKFLGITDDSTISNGSITNIQKIAGAISKNQNITTLYLQNNNLGIGNQKNIELMFESISKNQNITTLYLQNNDFGNGNQMNIELMFESISKNQNITMLYLQNNNLGNGNQKNIELMFESISKNLNITTLYLQNNNLGNGNQKDIELMFEYISKNQNITWLYLQNNYLGNGDQKNMELMFESISKNQNITWLYLQNNDLGNGNQKNIELIFESISKNQNITTLYLQNNNWKEGSKQMRIMEETKKKRNYDYFNYK